SSTSIPAISGPGNESFKTFHRGERRGKSKDKPGNKTELAGIYRMNGIQRFLKPKDKCFPVFPLDGFFGKTLRPLR
ncbi:MAG TPA: hypothetical protein VF799_05645, partial [Geobacteraceae bacterium]